MVVEPTSIPTFNPLVIRTPHLCKSNKQTAHRQMRAALPDSGAAAEAGQMKTFLRPSGMRKTDSRQMRASSGHQKGTRRQMKPVLIPIIILYPITILLP